MRTHDESTDTAARPRSRFLASITAEAELPPFVKPRDAAVTTTRAVLHQLTTGQAHVLVTSLPPDVRELFEPALDERTRRALPGRPHEGRPRGLVEVVDRVAADLGLAPASAEVIVHAVIRALREILPSDVTAHVETQLPRDLREVWRCPARLTVENIAGDLDLMRQILEDIDRSEALPLRVTPREAFSSVMCILAQRLSGGETKDLLLGLPRTIRPLVERCMLERREEPTVFGAEELAANVAQDLGTDVRKAEGIVAAVLAAVTRALPREELDHVASQLPEDLRALWLA